MLPVVSQSSKWAVWFCRAAARVSSGGSLVPAQTLSRARIHACWRSTRIAYWFWPSPDFYSSTSMRFTFFDWMVYNFYRPDLIQEYFGSKYSSRQQSLCYSKCFQAFSHVLLTGDVGCAAMEGKIIIFFFFCSPIQLFSGPISNLNIGSVHP